MEIVFAGFGGQGVLTAGLIVAEMALENGKNVTWMPAYGPTMRGGKAYSVVKYADGMIGGPDMEELDALVAMNEPSLQRSGKWHTGRQWCVYRHKFKIHSVCSSFFLARLDK